MNRQIDRARARVVTVDRDATRRDHAGHVQEGSGDAAVHRAAAVGGVVAGGQDDPHASRRDRVERNADEAPVGRVDQPLRKRMQGIGHRPLTVAKALTGVNATRRLNAGRREDREGSA